MRLLSIIFFVFLTGCSSFKQPLYADVPAIEVKTIALPTMLTGPCNFSKPPDKDIYLPLSPNDKEIVLTELVIHLYDDLSECNARMLSIEKIMKGG